MGYVHHGVAGDESDAVLDGAGPPAAATATAILSQPWSAWGREIMLQSFSLLAFTDLWDIM